MTIADIIAAGDRMGEILHWHLAAPLIDHDGGDEDDLLVKTRQFYRAIRKPRARWFRDGDRLFVVQSPELPPMPIRFGDPGDEC